MRAIGRDACEHGQGQARQERRSATSRGRWARRTKWNRVSRRGARWCSERQSGDGSRARRDRDEDRPEAGESATARRREEKRRAATGRAQRAACRLAVVKRWCCGGLQARMARCRCECYRVASVPPARNGRSGVGGLPEGAAGGVVQETVEMRDTATVHPLAASAGPGGRICQERGRGRW
jgi:hypothetical protein